MTLAVLALLAAGPFLLVAAIAIRLTSPGPVFYRQTRIGQAERPFTLLKLRTMHDNCDDASHRAFNIRALLGDRQPGTRDGIFKLEDDPRITWIGRGLRRFSVDEVPQLFNVIRGEMSLVGPRPSLPWEVEFYTPEQRRRHLCPPGMTGLWQVSGRNRLSMHEMLALDLAYVDQCSWRLDLWILARTPRAVLLDGQVR